METKHKSIFVIEEKIGPGHFAILANQVFASKEDAEIYLQGRGKRGSNVVEFARKENSGEDERVLREEANRIEDATPVALSDLTQRERHDREGRVTCE